MLQTSIGEGLALEPHHVVLLSASIGMLAVVMACGRWLELRLAALAGRRAGVVSVLALLLIGLILLFYRETTLS